MLNRERLISDGRAIRERLWSDLSTIGVRFMCVCRCPLKKLQKFERGQANILTKKHAPLPALLYRYNAGVPTERLKAFTMLLYQRLMSVYMKLLVTSDNIHYVNSLSLVYRLCIVHGAWFCAHVYDRSSTYTLVKRHIIAINTLYIRYFNAHQQPICALCTLTCTLDHA